MAAEEKDCEVLEMSGLREHQARIAQAVVDRQECRHRGFRLQRVVPADAL